MLLVEIEKPESQPLSDWFSELRNWLDHNHCVPATFVHSARPGDRPIYRISFDNSAQVHHFCTTFAHYSPVVRRADQFARDQLRTMASASSSWASAAD